MMSKRLRAFRRNRRAWWALLLLGALFLFCLAAEWVCPCDPRAVTDPKTLESCREPLRVASYAIDTARFSVRSEGDVVDFEGPDDVARAVSDAQREGRDIAQAVRGLHGGYRVRQTPREGYVRYFLDPLRPAQATVRDYPAPEISFPFRPCRAHPFGLDASGRDVYARVVHGLRIALLFGLALALSGLFIGLVVGSVEGYFGGRIDLTLQRLTEIWSALPFLYVMIFIGSTVGRSFAVLLVCYAIFNWISVSQYMRAEVLRLRGFTFVEAAKTMGLSPLRIVFSHILPNALTPLITLFPFLLMGAIGSLAALDFLGFGLPPLTPSCGELLAEAQQFREAWWLVLFPAAALFLVMLLTVLVGEGLRDAFDPRQKSRLE